MGKIEFSLFENPSMTHKNPLSRTQSLRILVATSSILLSRNSRSIWQKRGENICYLFLISSFYIRIEKKRNWKNVLIKTLFFEKSHLVSRVRFNTLITAVQETTVKPTTVYFSFYLSRQQQ